MPKIGAEVKLRTHSELIVMTLTDQGLGYTSLHPQLWVPDSISIEIFKMILRVDLLL